MSIKKVSLDMEKEALKMIEYYLKAPNSKRQFLYSKINECKNLIYEMNAKGMSSGNRARIENVDVYAENNISTLSRIENSGYSEIMLETQKKLLESYCLMKKIYDDIDIALISINPDICRAMEMYYAQKLSWKQMAYEFERSFQYVKKLINDGLNQIYGHLNADEVKAIIDFLNNDRNLY